ncbi:hypothetical protein Q3G72_012909 [Acer saccharum]|nr:hypothetical protein Q3G72_021343 [Acer saccharum]KAK1576322.1 hypothetical protein Q3G72_012909 [Acer saccharum]
MCTNQMCPQTLPRRGVEEIRACSGFAREEFGFVLDGSAHYRSRENKRFVWFWFAAKRGLGLGGLLAARLEGRGLVVEGDGLGTHDINDGDLTFLALLWQLSSKEFILFKRGYICNMENGASGGTFLLIYVKSISLLWCLVHLEDQ